MKYAILLLFVSLLGPGLYGMNATNGDPSDDDPKLTQVRTLEVSFHLAQLGSRPVYTEVHEMAGLSEDLRLGEGQVISGAWKDVEWKNQLVYIQIAERSNTGEEYTALSIMRYTNKGLKIKKVFNDIPDMNLDFFAL